MHFHLVSIKKPSTVKKEIAALKRIGARNRNHQKKPPATLKQETEESQDLAAFLSLGV